ncbi:MAG: SIS domain-containing protein [Nitrososphaerales archaeon]
MGGSGIIGELVADLAVEYDACRIDVLKDYHLPKYYTNDTLVIGVSCSGSTEETLSVVKEATKRGLDVCTFGSGGLLETLSKSNPRIKYTKTRMLKVPRSSFPLMFFVVLKFLVQNGYLRISDDHVADSIECLTRVRDLCSRPIVKQNKALEIAIDLTQNKFSFPLIYSSRRTRAVGLRFRQSLNENSKLHGYDGVIPELCHNEIVSWDYSSTLRFHKSKDEASDVAPVSLRLEDDPLEIKTRFQILDDILRKSRVQFIQAPSLGSTYISRMLSMLYFLDYSTYFAAILRGIDPLATPSIDMLKKELRTRLNYLGRFV